MSNRERAAQLMEQLPEYKLNLVIAYLQGLTAADEAEDDIYCENLHMQYEADPDKGNPISFADACKELEVVL